MRRMLAVLLICCTSYASEKPSSVYQEAVLVSFREEPTEKVTKYTLQVGDLTYVLIPKGTKKQAATAYGTMGWSAVFAKKSVLYRQLPGTHVQLRSDGDGIHVKLGSRESLFEMIAAQ
jgi:hypothetical protein